MCACAKSHVGRDSQSANSAVHQISSVYDATNMTVNGILLGSVKKASACGQPAGLLSVICQRVLSASIHAVETSYPQHSECSCTPSNPLRQYSSWHALPSTTVQQQDCWQQQWQQHRRFSWRANRPMTNPSMPSELTHVIQQSSTNNAVRPDPPPLQQRQMQFESRRAGVIAIKAGMMQDWDEYGARVPLTVLWIDECMVSRCQPSWSKNRIWHVSQQCHEQHVVLGGNSTWLLSLTLTCL